MQIGEVSSIFTFSCRFDKKVSKLDIAIDIVPDEPKA